MTDVEKIRKYVRPNEVTNSVRVDRIALIYAAAVTHNDTYDIETRATRACAHFVDMIGE